ncbi:MAG: hypothetical protein ACLTDR_12060 [Adlercreutzia equolifaciens]
MTAVLSGEGRHVLAGRRDARRGRGGGTSMSAIASQSCRPFTPTLREEGLAAPEPVRPFHAL